MTDSVLGILKIALLALLYLFFARVLWAVWSEVRGPRLGKVPAADQAAMVAAAPKVAPKAAAAPPATSRRRRSTVGKLAVLEPRSRKGSTFEVGTEITIGRSSKASISVPDDAFVSQLHARVYQSDGGTMVEDLASTNGTFVNGVQIQGTHPLDKGDRLQIGSIVLEAR